MAIAAAVIAAAGIMISGITKSNELKSQRKARQAQGDQELAAQKTLLRQQEGEAIVGAFSSGLTGGSFNEIFSAQAIEDAQFLGRIQQRTEFETKSLKHAAQSTLFGAMIGAGGALAGGIGGAKGGAGGGVPSNTPVSAGSLGPQGSGSLATTRQQNIFARKIGNNPGFGF